MEPSPTPSKPPSQSHAPRPISTQENGGRRSPGSTFEMPLAEGMRRPKIPDSRLDREMAAISLVVLNLAPRLNDAQRDMLDKAAAAARNVPYDVSPKTEFFATLGGGMDLLTLVLEEFKRIAP